MWAFFLNNTQSKKIVFIFLHSSAFKIFTVTLISKNILGLSLLKKIILVFQKNIFIKNSGKDIFLINSLKILLRNKKKLFFHMLLNFFKFPFLNLLAKILLLCFLTSWIILIFNQNHLSCLFISLKICIFEIL